MQLTVLGKRPVASGMHVTRPQGMLKCHGVQGMRRGFSGAFDIGYLEFAGIVDVLMRCIRAAELIDFTRPLLIGKEKLPLGAAGDAAVSPGMTVIGPENV